MKVNHDDPMGGHSAYARTLENICRKYFWHNMNDEVKKYVSTCDTCQRIKVHRHAPYGKLQPLPIPEGPADLMSMDFITGLPASKHGGQTYDAILVVVDAYTKYALYLPCRKDIRAQEPFPPPTDVQERRRCGPDGHNRRTNVDQARGGHDGHEAEFLRPMENDDDENERPRETRTDGCDDEAQVRRTHPRTQASQPGNHDPLPHVNHHEGCGPRG